MYDHKEPLALKQEYKTFVLVCVYNRLTILDLDDERRRSWDLDRLDSWPILTKTTKKKAVNALVWQRPDNRDHARLQGKGATVLH